MKQLAKADKGNAKEDEVLEFRVTEFSKENRRITVSHTAIWKEEERGVKAEAANKKAKEERATSKATKKLSQNVEKSTLGDIDVLSALKAQLETSEKETAAKKAEKIKAKADDKDAKATEEVKSDSKKAEKVDKTEEVETPKAKAKTTKKPAAKKTTKVEEPAKEEKAKTEEPKADEPTKEADDATKE